MIGFLLRTIGLWCTAGAVVALVIDGTRTIAAGALRVTPLYQAWQNLAPRSFSQAHTWVTSHSSQQFWSAIEVVLGLPSWLVLGAVGLGLIGLGAGRTRGTLAAGRY